MKRLSCFVESLAKNKKLFYSSTRGEIMLDITTQIIRGIIFIRLEGRLTTKTFYKVKEEINYLLYNQGMMAYVFNLEEVKEIDNNLLGNIQNKLTEIFLKCGSVAFCGISEHLKKNIGERRDQLFYLTEEKEVFQYISI